MISVVVANQKGGVGKTTTAVMVAHGLARRGYMTLLVDLDPQGQCASLLGMEQEPGVFDLLVGDKPLRDVIRTTGRDNLFILPGNKRTATAQNITMLERRGIMVLKDSILRPFEKKGPEYVVFDTAPSVGGLQEGALYTADLVLIPSCVDYLALEGVAQAVNTVNTIYNNIRGRICPPSLWILPTFYDSVTKESQANLKRLRQHFPQVFGPIHRATVIRQTAAAGKTLFELCSPETRAIKQYEMVVDAIARGTFHGG